MRIIIDKVTLNAIIAPDDSTPAATEFQPLRVRGGAVENVELQFVTGSPQVGERYPVDTVIQWALKRKGEYSGENVIEPLTFTRPATDAGYYTAVLDTSGPLVLAALHDDDGNPANDDDEVALASEITILADGATIPSRTAHVHLAVENFFAQASVTPVATRISDMSAFDVTGVSARFVGTAYIDTPEFVETLNISGGVNAGGQTFLSLAGMEIMTQFAYGGALTRLDARPCTALQSLTLVGSGIAELNITGLMNLSYLAATSGTLSAAQVNAILVALDNSGVTGGHCQLQTGNAAPTGAGITAKTSLIGKSWTVTTT